VHFLTATPDPKIARNIPKYIIAMIIRDLWLSMPIFIVYLQLRGLTYTQIGFLEASIAILIVVAEIPSGAIADLIGRRVTTALGLVGWVVGLVALGFFQSFWGFLVAYLCIGIGEALLSGASAALFYESLKVLGKADLYIRFTSFIGVFSACMIIFASIAGVELFRLSPSLPFYLHGLVVGLAMILILTMHEPAPLLGEISVKNTFRQMKNSLAYAVHHPQLRFLILFAVLIFIPMFLFVNILEQPYLLQAGFSLPAIGIIYALNRGAIGFLAPIRVPLEQKLGEKGSFFGIAAVYTVCFGIMATLGRVLGYGLIPVLMLLFFTRDFSRILLEKYSNDHAPSEKRATILSIVSFCCNFFYSVGALILGIIVDAIANSGMPSAIFVVGGFSLCCLGIVIYLGIHYARKENEKKLGG
jgi:MFS family permease